MALNITPWTIASDVTPEIATCAPTSGDYWVLSWLPERKLSFEQAVSGMVLDEILSDPEPADGDTALVLAEFRAAELGLTLAEVVVRLSVRVAQRDEYRRNPGRRQAPVVRSHHRDARPRTRQ